MKSYDVVIIGSGPAGIDTAGMLAQAGKQVCMIEKDPNNFGGTCANSGCMPTKALIRSAETVESAHKADQFGVSIPEVKPDMQKISYRVSETVKMLSGKQRMMREQEHDVIYGYGRFADNHHVEVEKDDGSTETVYGEHIVIATGSRPRQLPHFPIDGNVLCTSNELLKNDEIPESLLVIGTGAIGCEFASVYQRLGSDVTMVEMSDQIIPIEDQDTAEKVEEIFTNQGMNIYTSTAVKNITVENGQAVCEIEGQLEGQHTFDKVLLAIGRVPNTDDLNLEKAGVDVEKGKIKVNKHLQTTASNVFAAGDVIPTAMLAHTAVYESMVISSNVVEPESKSYDDKTAPRVIYTSPEIASVGLTEQEARDNYEVEIIDFPMQQTPKAILINEMEGRLKMIFDKANGTLLGANIIGENATELIHELTLAVRHKLTFDDLKETVHAHPSLAEIIWFALLKGQKKN